jgi:hypothetical protein
MIEKQVTMQYNLNLMVAPKWAKNYIALQNPCWSPTTKESDQPLIHGSLMKLELGTNKNQQEIHYLHTSLILLINKQQM